MAPARAKMKNTAEVKSESEEELDENGEPTNRSGGGKSKEESAAAADQHQDYCEVCEQGGEIILCDTCPRAYHLVCVEPEPLEEAPEGEWFCVHCERGGVATRKRKEAAEREAKRLVEEGTGIQHVEFCAACKLGGEQLLCCETCPQTYHVECLNPPLPRLPRHEWLCPKCACVKPKAHIKKLLNWRWKESESPAEAKAAAKAKKSGKKKTAKMSDTKKAGAGAGAGAGASAAKKPLLRIKFKKKGKAAAEAGDEASSQEDESELEREEEEEEAEKQKRKGKRKSTSAAAQEQDEEEEIKTDQESVDQVEEEDVEDEEDEDAVDEDEEDEDDDEEDDDDNDDNDQENDDHTSKGFISLFISGYVSKIKNN